MAPLSHHLQGANEGGAKVLHFLGGSGGTYATKELVHVLIGKPADRQDHSDKRLRMGGQSPDQQAADWSLPCDSDPGRAAQACRGTTTTSRHSQPQHRHTPKDRRSVCACVCVCLTRMPAAVAELGVQPHLCPHWPEGGVTSQPLLCLSVLPAAPPIGL